MTVICFSLAIGQALKKITLPRAGQAPGIAQYGTVRLLIVITTASDNRVLLSYCLTVDPEASLTDEVR